MDYTANEMDRGRLKLIFAWIAPADASGVPFDLGQGRVERAMRPPHYAFHSFQGMARRTDHELMRSACRDVSHRATEQVRQLPNCASLHGRDDHIHIEPPGPLRRAGKSLR